MGRLRRTTCVGYLEDTDAREEVGERGRRYRKRQQASCGDGVDIETFEIGNEIDPGIWREFEPDRRTRLHSLRSVFCARGGAKIVGVVHKRVMIGETVYPAAGRCGGQFAEWNLPTEGYLLSDDGQAKWIADLAAIVRQCPP